MRLILIRHGLPHRAGSPDGDGTGATADPELTPLGHRQAAGVATALTGTPVDAIYSSPLRRARQTAEPLASVRDIKPQVVDDLAEYDAGDRHYVPVHLMAEVAPDAWERMLAGQLPEYVDVPAFQARVVGALERIADAHPGTASVACFAHAGVINVYLAALLGLDRPLTFPLDYAGLTRISVSRNGRRSVRTINEIAHVIDLLDPESAGLPDVPDGPVSR
ncbi:histidine phosphatase family protein [Pseudonocardia eucalypti]|uniref:Histidine phosphatase family protein n=1 Tax=Pseudonocardia eucalypti TaxID=648755 RepID=A0ABP9QWI6_9PSEU|nr:putative phosphoglycerate mutase [Pseudonocardia eucalypti]